MLNNLETIKQTTKESIELLAQIQSDIDSILKLGLFDDNKTKQKHWKRIQQLLHSEDNTLKQIDNVQSYFCSIIEELDKIKPTSKDIKQRQQAMTNFLESMKFKEYSFVGKDTLMKEQIFEVKVGLLGSIVNSIKGIFGSKGNSNNDYDDTDDVTEPTETIEINTKKKKV